MLKYTFEHQIVVGDSVNSHPIQYAFEVKSNCVE